MIPCWCTMGHRGKHIWHLQEPTKTHSDPTLQRYDHMTKTVQFRATHKVLHKKIGVPWSTQCLLAGWGCHRQPGCPPRGCKHTKNSTKFVCVGGGGKENSFLLFFGGVNLAGSAHSSAAQEHRILEGCSIKAQQLPVFYYEKLS